MNKARRKAINAQYARLTTLQQALADLKETASDIQSELQQLHDDEDEAYNNLPEGLQQAESGQKSQEAAENIQTAIDALDELDSITDFVEALEALDSAGAES